MLCAGGRSPAGTLQHDAGEGPCPALRAAGIHRSPLIGGKPDIVHCVFGEARRRDGDLDAVTIQAVVAGDAYRLGPLRPGRGEQAGGIGRRFGDSDRQRGD